MINICVPVLKRYDLLKDMLKSLEQSTVLPECVYVIDNGRHMNEMVEKLSRKQFPVLVYTPSKAMGVAESWNWFIDNVSEERLITNDDILFAPESLGALIAPTAPFTSCTFGFSCFVLRDECVRRVGHFDETISPGYAYFEDMDYLRRMKMAKVVDVVVQCGVVHHHSQTPAAYSVEEWREHHRRFNLAQSNYEKKWANAPSWEQLQAIGGAGSNQ